MSLLNNLVKVAFVGGAVIGGTVAYARLNDEQKEKVQRGMNKVRRKVSDFIAPNDGAYKLPKEIEEELNALITE
jgi:uncharacterized membrane protein YebE (DUF533 family)